MVATTDQFHCKYTESTDQKLIIDNLQTLSSKIFVANIKNGNDDKISPVIIGSRALLYKIEADPKFKQLYDANPKLYNVQPKDWNIIMTPVQALTIVKKTSNPMKLYILDVDNIPYYKLIIEDGVNTQDITIITDAKQPMYKLAMYCQNLRCEYFNGIKMIYASVEVLHMLKSINLFYKTDFDKHIRHYIILSHIAQFYFINSNTVFKTIKNDFIKESIIIKGPRKELPAYDKTLDPNPIISYMLDQFLSSELANDIRISYNDILMSSELADEIRILYNDALLLFGTSVDGDKYWLHYINRLTSSPLVQNYTIRDIYHKYYEIKKNRMDLYERYFSADEIDKARKYGEPALKTPTSIQFNIDDLQYTIFKNSDIDNSIRFNIEYSRNLGSFGKFTSVIEPFLTISWSSAVYNSASTESSESTTYTDYVVSKYKPNGYKHDLILLLLRIAMIYLPIDPRCQTYYMSDGRNHPVVSIYIGRSLYITNPENHWVNRFRL